MTSTKIITTLFFAFIALCLWALLLDFALHKQELNECTEWTEQAKEIPGEYWLLEWQYDQCEAVGRPLPSGFLKGK